MKFSLLVSEADYDAALARLDEIMNAVPGTPEDKELGQVIDAIEAYEKIHYPIDTSDVKSVQEERAEALLQSLTEEVAR